MLPAIRELDGAGRSYQANADLDLIVLEEGLIGKMVSAHRCTGGSFKNYGSCPSSLRPKATQLSSLHVFGFS